MIQITGHQLIAINKSLMGLLRSGMLLEEAYACLGIVPGSKIHLLLGSGFDQVVKNPDCKITLVSG